MTTPISFVRGTDLRIAATAKAGGVAVNIESLTVVGEIWWDEEKKLDLTVANGRLIRMAASQGRFDYLLSEVDTASLPEGARSYIKTIFATDEGDTSASRPLYLEGLY